MSVYTILNERLSLPVVLHIPHSATFIPPDLEPCWLVARAELEIELRALTDWHTDELYQPFIAKGGTGIRYDYSRFVVDPERFEDDTREPMASRGMGVVYTHGVQGTPLRRAPTPTEREALLRRTYRPYHRTLERLVAESVRRFGQCLIIDGHSFPAAALPYELNPKAPRPDICLGTVAAGQSPEELVTLVEQTVRDHGLSVGRNTPFGGAIMPSRYVGDPAVATIMIETNRRLYLDDRTAEKTGEFAETVALMETLAERVREWLART